GVRTRGEAANQGIDHGALAAAIRAEDGQPRDRRREAKRQLRAHVGEAAPKRRERRPDEGPAPDDAPEGATRVGGALRVSFRRPLPETRAPAAARDLEERLPQCGSLRGCRLANSVRVALLEEAAEEQIGDPRDGGLVREARHRKAAWGDPAGGEHVAGVEKGGSAPLEGGL